MSMIFGKCNANKVPVTTSEINAMLSELKQWPSDRSDTWANEHTGLGQIMLYNTSESIDEKLPFHDSLSKLTITADARIDNRSELFTLLNLNTPSERKVSDSYLILLAYKKYGKDCIKYLIGDFAFAIWDEQNQKLFCARDQMGIKPFFYYHRDGFFAFASQKKAILCLPGIDKTINKDYFYTYVFPVHVQAADTTIFANISRLTPAHSVTYYPTVNKVELCRYWTLDPYTELKFQHKEEYYEGLKHHFEEAVKCRLRSNFPMGLELSGGMDSSSIAGVASHFLKSESKKLSTFTNAHNSISESHARIKNMSEERYAQAVIDFNGITDYHFINSEISDDPIFTADLILKVLDGFVFWNLYWGLPIKKKAMELGIRTIFSGFGGDEMATYGGEHYFLDYLDQNKILKYLGAKSKYKFKKFKPFLNPELEFILHRLRNVITINSKKQRNITNKIHVPLRYRLTKGDVAWRDINYIERFKSFRHFQRYRLLKPQVSIRMETENHYGSAFGMETRFPMADIRLTQFYLSMPNEIKYEGTMTRSAWRKAMSSYLPIETLERDSKIGYLIPYMHDPAILQRKIVAANTLSNSIKSNSKHHKTGVLKFQASENNALNNIILLRWLENNFADL